MRIRSGYSFGTAYGHLPDVFKRAQFDGVAPITDRASTFGWNPWAKLAKTNNVRPVYGVELAVSANPFSKKERDIDYFTFTAKNDLKPLNDLVRKATCMKGEPVLHYRDAMEAEGVFRIASGNGPLSEMQWYVNDPNTYVALSPSLSTYAFNALREMGAKFILSNDNYYPAPEDEQLYALTIGRNASSQTYPRHIMNLKEMLETFTYEHRIFGMALQNMWNVLNNAKAEIGKGHLVEPIGVKRSLIEECVLNAKPLGIDLDRQTEYLERLEYELRLIDDKGFTDYFHIVGDLVRWARARMLVGPARGSSCGSLVCYLLGITTVDPLRFGLLFERFIDINRSDLPDIDIDFSDQHRASVFEYLEQKYGKERVARIGTVQMFKHRSALQVGGAAFKVPKWRVDALADVVEPRAAGDARANLSLTDAFEMLPLGKKLIADFPDMAKTAKIEGHPKHYSQHAAGVIITDKPVIDYVAIDSRSNATMCDMRDAEAMNLLKIDALGLTQLSIFEDAFALIGKSPQMLFDLTLDDPLAFEVFNRGDFLGIFQFNGKALQGITNQIKVTSFDDIVSITALARPGPINSGATQTWIERKRNSSQVLSLHPVFDPILKPTLGVIVYQEQIMQMCRAVGMDWSDVIAVRKAMGKSQGLEAMRRWQDKFVAGCVANDMPQAQAETLWLGMCEFGAYAFNKSHSVAYAVISYWCAWLKARYPSEFAAATLTHENDLDKQIAFLRELERNGIFYKAFDIKQSTDKWTVDRTGNSNTLIGPVSNIIGIGPVGQREFVESRTGAFKELSPATDKKIKMGKTKLDTLWPIRDALAPLVERQPTIKSESVPISTINDPGFETGWNSILVLAQIDKMTIKNENDEASVARRGRKLDGETTALNLWLRDDTGTLFAKIDRSLFAKMGQTIIDGGGAGKALYAFRGTVRQGEFRMLSVLKAMYLGERK